MSALAVIPARYASSRLPGKPLIPLCGKPMIEHVWERVRRASKVSRVLVATDDEQVRRAVEAFGGEAVMTRADHRCGTERVAEVAALVLPPLPAPSAVEGSAAAGSEARLSRPGCSCGAEGSAAAGSAVEGDILVNVQGDEPLIDPAAVDAAVDVLLADASALVATLAVPIAAPADIMDPNVVKVVLDFDGNALYFSRAPIPWVRGNAGRVHSRHLKHVGLYAFRRSALLEFPTFPQGELEKLEQLEQLRWLENGYKIRVAETSYDSVSVDVPEDIPRVEKLLQHA